MESEFAQNYLNPLFTDFYQMTMAYAYFKNGLHEQPAVFEAFFRKCPFKGNYAVFGGLDEVVEFLEKFKFTESDIQFLKERMAPETEDAFFQYL
jgi:nicotinate phosphoribosyltransferase